MAESDDILAKRRWHQAGGWFVDAMAEAKRLRAAERENKKGFYSGADGERVRSWSFLDG